MLNVKVLINRYRWLFNAFQLFGSRPPFPLLLLVHITSECQCACPICYQQHEDSLWGGWRGHMDEDRFEKLLQQARAFFRRPLVHLYGGEPLIHPRFDAFVGLLKEYGFEATINTNGELLERYLGELAGGPIRMINVSLDGIGERHDSLRQRPGLFQKAVDGMRVLRERDDALHLNLNYVVSETNAARLFADILEFAEIFRGTRVDYFSIEHLAYTADMAHLADSIDVDALKDNLKKIKESEFPFPVSATPVVRIEDLDRYYRSFEPARRINCNVPWIALNVFPNGDLTPGGAMFACTRRLGNSEALTLREAWNGRKMRAFRKEIRRAMPDSCFRCCHTLHDSPLVTCRTIRETGRRRSAGTGSRRSSWKAGEKSVEKSEQSAQ